MNKTLAENLSTMFNVPVDKLQALDSDAVTVDAIQPLFKDLKIFKNNTEFQSVLKNYHEGLKSGVEKQANINARASLEKDLLAKHNVTLEHGKDFATTEELLDKIISIKAKPSGDPTADQKKIIELEQAILAEKKTAKDSLTQVQTAAEKKYFNAIISSELKNVSNIIDIDEAKLPGHLKFLKFQFDEQFSLKEGDDGSTLVIDKKGEIQKDGATFKPLTADQVLLGIVTSFSNIKDSSRPHGRGSAANGGGNQNNGPIDFSAFKSWKELSESNHGKGLITGSKAQRELMTAFYKAHPELK